MGNGNNVIFISIDDLRFDCIGCEENKSWLSRYNADTLVDTPNIDWFASRGTRFSQCVSVSSYTPAPHASMLTGVYPYRHKVRTFLDKLSGKAATLPEILNNRGYESFAIIEHFALRALDITRGFLLVDNRLEDEDEVLDELARRKDKGRNTFLFIHVFDIHSPYYFATGTKEDERIYNRDYLETMREVVEASGLKFERLLQDARREARRVVDDLDNLPLPLIELAEMRSLNYLWRIHLKGQGRLFEEVVPLYVKGVGKFDKGKFADLITRLKELNLLTQESLLIITSDHGECRCRWDGQENFMNSFHLLEGAIRVPLIFYSPQKLPAKVVDAPVSLVDIVPTVLDFLGVDPTAFNLDGESLLPVIEGKTRERPLFSETWAYKGGINQFGQYRLGQECFRRQLAVRSNNYKYIETGEAMSLSHMNTLSSDEFVKAVYRKILGRFENQHELAYWSKALNNRWITRIELRDRFIKRMNCLGLNRMLFDLTTDPWEENNLAGSGSYANSLREMATKIHNYKHIESISESISRLKALGRL